MWRVVQQIIIILLLIIFLASLPMMIMVDPDSQSIKLDVQQLPEVYGQFFTNLMEGSLGTYQLGYQERSIAQDISDNFFTSLSIMLIGINAAIVTSIVFGIFISRFKITRVFGVILNILATIPDFIIILLSMILAVNFYKMTGIRIISMRPEAGALNLWFPIILAGFAPTVYLFKLIAVKYYQTGGEDYIRTAVAKGMKLNYINFQHVFKNIEPFIAAELIKVISLGIGNLFIIEYILNVPGITKFIFQSAEIQPIAVGLICMLIISLLVFLSVKLVFFLFKRGFIYE
ncbi:ABC transporter permease subunit [Cytobacillus gottheilii]|uniref:ABC transporter permease subunit n=1 Tax=Cytobacillus gottheilii TaxID=859144 RepID=A0ABX8F7P6_9BACI|nr:ABC transporter permease subunit [Cytobacillus gottheilii]QVY60130.1 ABC transporter permease subunit [Cytobacillus gottheilii]